MLKKKQKKTKIRYLKRDSRHENIDFTHHKIISTNMRIFINQKSKYYKFLFF